MEKERRRELLLEQGKSPAPKGTPNIFLSIGRPLCDPQMQFKLALQQAVRARGFEPRTVGSGEEDSDVPSGRPIEQIKSLVEVCDGAIVVAYERHFTTKLIVNSPTQEPGELTDVRFSTSWNQAEAAMAFFADLPIFLILEKNVHGECILEEGTVGAIEHITVGREAVFADVFQRRMANWAERVLTHKNSKAKKKFHANPDEMSVSDVVELLGGLSWKSAVLLGGLLIGLVGAIYSLGYSHLLTP